MSVDVDTARSFVERHPGFAALVDKKTCMFSMSKPQMLKSGLQPNDLSRGISYYDMPVKGRHLAKYFDQTDKEVMSGKSHMKILMLWRLQHNEEMLVLGEKFPLKDKNDKVVATFNHNIDITKSALIDISRFLQLCKDDQYVLGNYDQFFYKIYTNDHTSLLNISEKDMRTLFYILRGKSARDIGNLLHLSFRTVEDQFRRLKHKFQVSNKADLVEQAILLGYMNVLPQSLLINGI